MTEDNPTTREAEALPGAPLAFADGFQAMPDRAVELCLPFAPLAMYVVASFVVRIRS